jgi:non-ribosomal peptide synthetase component F
MTGAPLAVRLELGTPQQLGPDRPGAGEPLRRYLPTILVRDLRALAPRLRATTFLTVLAAFEVVLARRSGLDDLVFATVVAARRSTDCERTIGCFPKKVLLRVRLEDDPPFGEVVARTRVAVLGALARQDLPFEAMVQDTIGRATAQHGLPAQVPVVFQSETPQRLRLAMPGGEVTPFEMGPPTLPEGHLSGRDEAASEQVPTSGDGAWNESFLVLSLLELEDGLALIARGIFHRPAMRRLLEDVEALLTEIAASPDKRMSELGLAHPGPPEGSAPLRALADDQVARRRSPEMLAAALAATRAGRDAGQEAPPTGGGPKP